MMKINGKKVVDAKGPLHLVITPTDVSNGKIKEAGSCAAAVAAKRQCNGAIGARVYRTRAYVEYKNKVVRYRTGSALRTEIVSFDRGHKFEAGAYDLNPPFHSDALTGKHRGGPHGDDNTRAHRRNAKKRQYHLVTGIRDLAPRGRSVAFSD